MRNKLIIFFILITSGKSLFSQTEFYHIDTIREVKIYFTESNWDHILDSLYVDGLKERLLCSVEVDGIPYDSVGVRYKGFSSVSINRTKNPFNIKLDYTINGQNHNGIDKLKLGNVIQDPSFVREVLTYEIARKYLPSSEANYAKVFINDVYWGLYSNIEPVNKDFVSNHFASRNNSFFKGNPEDLDLYGENSNLGNSSGTDSSDYYDLYDMESDNGWSDLYDLIDTLNNQPDEIQALLNVDRTLWMHALNYTLINFDSYVGYAQNYYLYQDDNGRFNPIIWDLNMSFGSFRLADASEFYDGFSIENASTLDPLTHYNSFSVFERPLLRNLFENDRYRRMYLAHMRTILEENISNNLYADRAMEMQGLIDQSVQEDTNKFYSYEMFQDNLNSTVSDLIDYPGIVDLMSNRETYLWSYPGFQGSPSIDSVQAVNDQISVGDDIYITAQIQNASSVYLAYRFGSNEVFQEVQMLDNGSLNDGTNDDGIFGGLIADAGNTIQYYIYAENDSAGRFSPARAAYEFYTIQNQIQPGDLVINEFMASNTGSYADQDGEYNDWIELYNTTDASISTAGLHLSDDSTNVVYWPMPDVVIPANEYLIVWADGDTQQSGIHASFKLSSNGEELSLAYGDSTLIDTIYYGGQQTDVAYARSPNGTGDFTFLQATPGGNNNFSSVEGNELNKYFSCYPNPFENQLTVLLNLDENVQLEIRDLEGRLLLKESVQKNIFELRLNTSFLSRGVYFVNVFNDSFISSQKMIKIQ